MQKDSGQVMLVLAPFEAGMATLLFWTTCTAWIIAWDPGASIPCLFCMCIGAICAAGVIGSTMLLGACVCTGIMAPGGAWTHAPAGAVTPCGNCPRLICGACVGRVGTIGTLNGASITALCAGDMKALIVRVAGAWLLCPACICVAWWGTDGTTECSAGTKLRGA